MRKRFIGAIAILSCVAIIGISKVAMDTQYVKAEGINKFSSKELLEKVLDNDKLDDIIFYNSQDDVIAIAKSCIVEFEELVSREDFVETIVAYYDNYRLVNNYATDDKIFDKIDSSDKDLNNTIESLLDNEVIVKDVDRDIEEATKVFFLEELLTSKEVLKKASEEEIACIKEVSYNKFSEKEKSNFHKDNADNIYERALEKDTNVLVGIKQFQSKKVKRNGAEKDVGVEASVKTPNGTTVKVLIYKYFGDEMADLLNIKAKKEYPDAEILEQSDNRYNCHSYAWYQADKHNRYWMKTPRAYLIDGSYEKTTEINPSNKVVWIDYDGKRVSYVEHSGIVESVIGDEIVIVSKWGQGPLVRHNITYSPYKHDIEYFKEN